MDRSKRTRRSRSGRNGHRERGRAARSSRRPTGGARGASQPSQQAPRHDRATVKTAHVHRDVARREHRRGARRRRRTPSANVIAATLEDPRADAAGARRRGRASALMPMRDRQQPEPAHRVRPAAERPRAPRSPRAPRIAAQAEVLADDDAAGALAARRRRTAPIRIRSSRFVTTNSPTAWRTVLTPGRARACGGRGTPRRRRGGDRGGDHERGLPARPLDERAGQRRAGRDPADERRDRPRVGLRAHAGRGDAADDLVAGGEQRRDRAAGRDHEQRHRPDVRRERERHQRRAAAPR